MSPIRPISTSKLRRVLEAGLMTVQFPATHRRCQFPCCHQQREIPGDDLSDNPERLFEVIGDGIRYRVRQRRPSSARTQGSELTEMGRWREETSALRSLANGLAVIDGFQASARSSRFSSILFAIFNKTSARAAGEVCPHASLAA